MPDCSQHIYYLEKINLHFFFYFFILPFFEIWRNIQLPYLPSWPCPFSTLRPCLLPGHLEWFIWGKVSGPPCPGADKRVKYMVPLIPITYTAAQLHENCNL